VIDITKTVMLYELPKLFGWC